MEGAGYSNGSDSTHRSGPLHPDLRPPSERSERSESSRRSERDTIYDLRKQLIAARQQIQAFKKRAAEQDGEMQTLVSLVKQVNEARLNALQEAARANEELRLYKLRFEDAKSEINYAQDLLRIVERQRNQAEQAALDARTEARVLNLEKRVENVFRDTRQNMEHQRRSWQQTMPDSESDRSSEVSGSHPYDDTGDPLSAIQPQEVTPPPPVDPPPAPSSVPPSAPPSAPRSPVPVPVSPAPIPISPQPIFAPSPRAESILVPPRSVHNASPSVQHEHIEIPPDGFIPSLDEDGGLRLPPPHELAKPPPTPERGPSPALSNAPIPVPPASIPPSPAPSSRSRRDGPTPVPPISIPPSPAPSSRSRRDAPTVPPSPALSSRSRKTQRQGSGSSVSTALSQFDLFKDPIGANTPLSAIPEVNSGAASPNQPSIYQGTPAPASPYQPIPVYQATPAPSTYIPPPSEGGLSRRPSLTQSVRSARTPAGYTASIPPATHSRKDSNSNATTVLMVPAPPMVPPPNPHITTSRPESRMSSQSHHPSLSRRQSVGSVASSRRTGAPANASYYAGTPAPIYAQSHLSRHDAADLDELRSEPGSVATPPSESSDFDRDPLQTPSGDRRPSIYATGS